MQIKKSSLTVNLWLAGMAAAYLPAGAAGQSIFQVVPTPNDNSNNGLFAVAASSPSDIWAVGDSTIHFDGTKWTAFEAPFIKGDNTSFLQGVADISATEAWAVGNVIDGPHTGPVIERWDGTQWSVFPSRALPPGDSANLFAITAISADDIWAVGNVAIGNIGANLFEHWDGTTWTPTITAVGGTLIAASSDATDDVWAVGFSGFSGAEGETLVAHYNGTIWRSVPSPNVGANSTFNAVVALAPNDVWAVGSSIAVTHDPTVTLIEHYDGSKWSVVPSPNVGPNSANQSNRLFGITAVSPTDIWAFGSYFAANGSGNQMTLLLHWDGSAWSIAPSPNPVKGDFLDDVLFGGVVTAPGSVWIVGSEDTAAPNQPIFSTLVLHSHP
jgi:hypothetical protein